MTKEQIEQTRRTAYVTNRAGDEITMADVKSDFCREALRRGLQVSFFGVLLALDANGEVTTKCQDQPAPDEQSDAFVAFRAQTVRVMLAEMPATMANRQRFKT